MNKGKGKGNNFKSFDKKHTEVVNAQIKDIDLHLKKVSVTAKINRIVQTGGPTVFMATDGTGNLALKGFISPGARAYPEIDEGDVVTATVNVGEFQGEIEGEIILIKKADEQNKEHFLKLMKEVEFARAKVAAPEFLVRTPILDRLKDKFEEAATHIRLAVIQDRPIIVRHHNDADGYSSGYALERAILPLIAEQHNNPKARWEYFSRAPCQAPFYELDDSIRDTANSLRNVAKFSNKMPLIIIADNGSSEEDLMAIEQGRIHGADFIVVDHHGFDKDVISDVTLTHINPILNGDSGAEISAGMLCVELARFIYPEVEGIVPIAAMCGYADRIELAAPDTMDKYLKLAEEEGYDKSLLSDISTVVDYVSAKVRFMEVREYIEVIMGESREQQKKLVDLLAPHIKKMDAKGTAIGVSNAKQEKIGNVTLQTIEVEKTFPGFGFFPKPGRATGFVHDAWQKSSGDKAVVTAGVMNTAITMRATDAANFSVHELKKYIEEKCPGAFVEGGGHKNAGALSFLPYKKEEVVTLLKEFIANCK